MSDIAIRGDVPIDLHPDALLGEGKVLNKNDTVGQRAYHAAREALSSVYETYAKMEETEKALQAAAKPSKRSQAPVDDGGKSLLFGDVRMMHGGTLQAFHGHEADYVEAAGNAVQRVSLTVDRRITELEGYRDALQTRVANAVDDPNRKKPEGLALAGEIRTHLKGLEQGKRLDFVKKAISAGDRGTVAAVLHAPAYLSGLTNKQLSTLHEFAAASFARVDYEQLRATEVAIERVSNGGSRLLGRYVKAQALADTAQAHARKQLNELGKVK